MTALAPLTAGLPEIGDLGGDRPSGGRRRALVVRLLQGVLTLVIVILLVFLLTRARSPRSIALANLPPGDRSASDVQGYILAHHLNEPLPTRLWDFLWSLAHFQLGESSSGQLPVTHIVMPAFWRTLSLVGPAFVITTLSAIAIGAYLAEHVGNRFERIVTGFLAVADSLPSFVIGIAVLLLFAVELNWFQISSQLALSYGTFQQKVQAYALPMLSLILLQTPYCSKLARQAFLDAYAQPYARASALRGLSRRAVRWRCVLPNTASVLVHSYGLVAATMVAGSLVIENVFSFPGIGRLSVSAISEGDQPTLVGIVLVTSAWLITVSTLADALATWIDPKLKTA